MHDWAAREFSALKTRQSELLGSAAAQPSRGRGIPQRFAQNLTLYHVNELAEGVVACVASIRSGGVTTHLAFSKFEIVAARLAVQRW